MSTDPRAFSLGHGWLHPHMEGVKQWGGALILFLPVCLSHVCVCAGIHMHVFARGGQSSVPGAVLRYFRFIL